MPTPQEIQATQGTRLSSENPWDSYSTEMNGPAMSPELAAQVAAYAATRNDGKTSSQTQEILAENREINEGIKSRMRFNSVVQTGVPGFIPRAK